VPSNAVARREPARVGQALEHARLAARIADDNRARDVVLLDLRQATPLLDFFVIATAGSRRQSHAIASEIDAEMKKRGEHKLGMEGSEEGRWILIDYGDFVVHIFSQEGRAYYALEEIWGDAPKLELDLAGPRAKPALAEPPAGVSPEADEPSSST
jgi:ribosome-associated protein